MNLEPLRYFYLRRVLGTVISSFGIELADRLARRLACRVSALHTPARRLAESRLSAAFVNAALNPRANPQSVSSSMYEHIARFWIEALFAKRLLRPSSWRRFVSVRNESDLVGLSRSPRGCLLATAYFGNPAVAAIALGRLFRPLHIIVDTLTQPYLRAWQTDLYADRHVRVIDRRHASRQVPDVLAAGGAVMMIADHERPRGRSVPTTFLGRTLNCYPTLGRLAKWFDAPVAVVSCLRGERAFSFNLTLHSVIDPASHDNPDDLVRLAMAVLERAILSHPGQYLWSLPDPAVSAAGPAPHRKPRRLHGAAVSPVDSRPRRPCQSLSL